MDYTGDLAVLQQSAAATRDYTMRRQACLQFTAPRDGEKILEVGCGGGLFLNAVAEAVGANGFVCGVDLSEQQIAKARQNCQHYDQIELHCSDAVELQFDDAEFDAVVSIQTIEFIPDLDGVVSQLLRVLKPGGRFVNFATNWNTIHWNSNATDRMDTILKAGQRHTVYPSLPAILPDRLRATGLVGQVRQEPVTILNTSYAETEFSYWNARLIAAFVTSEGLVSRHCADRWLDDLQEVATAGEYHFCSTGVLTGADRT